ncbi:acyl-CoA dehydrogenase family protein [Mycolicibacterium sp. 050232]|uniref:acyl-CoA dehydrogenase family protein n=1 Tax=Mycolicibacterium sp. 050232 TaxID=3113982 RepID=UPI002E2AEEFE|nr:acyl-CoA dehydrogenase family protein [Mycolicibacterium sp. 050232]MED5814685.1 acyl-CoA dehydrogenase family protein [Mycolicibacterium sp. 050232]
MLQGPQTHLPQTPEDVLTRVDTLVDELRARAPETERLRRMHPDNLRTLTDAGLFRLAMPADVGGYQADEHVLAEALAQVARGCPSTGWMCTIMSISNLIPALLADEAADEIYATPDLRISTAVAPSGQATPVDGGFRVTGRWAWNTAGVHSNWLAGACVVVGQEERGPRLMLIPATAVQHHDTWRAAGMAGTATNTAEVNDLFVPAARSILFKDLANGDYPLRRYSDLSYFNRPFVMFINACSAPALLGMARGAMDCFMTTLQTRGAITYTAWSKAAEAPLLHHQLAAAQYSLEAAEMFTDRLTRLYAGALDSVPTMLERARARAYIGHIASLSRACVNQLFEASSASQTLLAADIQRYFRDINALHQHAAIQPNSGDEVYGRVLTGLDPRSEIV